MCLNIVEEYRVIANKDVFLNITSGYGQLSSVFLTIDGVKKVEDPGNVEMPFKLGTGSDLNGKKLSCTVGVACLRDSNMKTSVIYELEGGPDRLEKTCEKTAEGGERLITYTATIYFEV